MHIHCYVDVLFLGLHILKSSVRHGHVGCCQGLTDGPNLPIHLAANFIRQGLGFRVLLGFPGPDLFVYTDALYCRDRCWKKSRVQDCSCCTGLSAGPLRRKRWQWGLATNESTRYLQALENGSTTAGGRKSPKALALHEKHE